MSSVLTIRGGVPLTGRVTVRGAKNLVPKAMVAALLGNEPSVLRNVPEIKDVEVVTSLLQLHGVTVDKDPVTGDLTLDPTNAKTASHTAIDAPAGDSRIPILLCGPLIHAIGEAFIPDLGGCKIGARRRTLLSDTPCVAGAELRADFSCVSGSFGSSNRVRTSRSPPCSPSKVAISSTCPSTTTPARGPFAAS